MSFNVNLLSDRLYHTAYMTHNLGDRINTDQGSALRLVTVILLCVSHQTFIITLLPSLTHTEGYLVNGENVFN